MKITENICSSIVFTYLPEITHMHMLYWRKKLLGFQTIGNVLEGILSINRTDLKKNLFTN